MSTQDEPEFVTLPVAARRLGVGLRQLRRARDRGELATYRLGAWPRVRWGDVLAWIESRRCEGTAGRVGAKS